MPPNKKKEDKKASPQPPTPWYLWPFQCLYYTLNAWIVLVLVEWLGPWWGWSRGEHAKSVFFEQLALLQGDFPNVAQQIIDSILEVFAAASWLTEVRFTGVFTFVEPFWLGLVYATLALLARIVMLGAFYPTFLLALFVGVFDGLVVRQRRIAHVDREHATIHFYSKKLLAGLLLMTGGLWLIIPGLWPVHPVWMLLPGAVATGIIARMMVGSYKKYL